MIPMCALRILPEVRFYRTTQLTTAGYDGTFFYTTEQYILHKKVIGDDSRLHDPDVVGGLVLGRSRSASDALDYLHSAVYSSKYRVLSIQPRSGRERDEELRSIGIGS